jgi:hypothetical protein
MESHRRRKITRIVVPAALVLLAAGLLFVVLGRRGSSIDRPCPVTEASSSPGRIEALLQGLHLREFPPLRMDPKQETDLVNCIKLSRLINQSVSGVARFDTPTTRDQLLGLRQSMSVPFYAEFLLAQWYVRNGTADQAERWRRAALEHAPVVLVRPYRFMDGTPLAQTKVGTLGVECRMKTATSSDTYQSLEYIDLVTDEKGQVYLPCYDTRIRCVSVHWPHGYEVEVGRHGYLEINARYSLLPTIYVWKKGAPRPATDLPPSQFSAYKEAQQVQGLTYLLGQTEFRIDRCFRQGQDGAVLAGDGRNAVSLSGSEPLPSFGEPCASLDQAMVRFKRSSPAGNAILQVRLFDHRSRGLLSEYHAPAFWSYDGQDEIFLKSFARPLPQSLDVWFWVTTFNSQDKVQQVLPQVGAAAEFTDYKAALTHIHSGFRSFSTTGSVITFGPPDPKEQASLQVAFQITPKQTRAAGEYARLVAVSKTGVRLLADSVIHPSQQALVCDFPMKLSDLDHFDLCPVGQESCFLFDGVSLPAAENRELAQTWQTVIPTRGQTGSFATPGTQPAHLEITILPGRNAMSFSSHGLSDPLLPQTQWTYGSESRDPDTYTTIVCEMTGLTARMLRTDIEPLDTGNNPLAHRGGSGQAATFMYRTFPVPARRIDAVRVTLSWSAE